MPSLSSLLSSLRNGKPAGKPANVKLTDRAEALQQLILSIGDDNNLIRDLRRWPDSFNVLADTLAQLPAEEMTYLAKGSTALAFSIENNRIVKLSRPAPGDSSIASLSDSKDFILSPITSKSCAVPGGSDGTLKVEIYPRVMTYEDMLTDPRMKDTDIKGLLNEYKLLMREVIIRDGFLNSDLNNGNIGLLQDTNGNPVSVTTADGNTHFVPVIIDHEKIAAILPEYLSNYDDIRHAEQPEIIGLWRNAIRETIAQYQSPPLAEEPRNWADAVTQTAIPDSIGNTSRHR